MKSDNQEIERLKHEHEVETAKLRLALMQEQRGEHASLLGADIGPYWKSSEFANNRKVTELLGTILTAKVSEQDEGEDAADAGTSVEG